MDTPLTSGGESFVKTLKKIVRESNTRADGFRTPKSNPVISDERNKPPAKRQFRRIQLDCEAEDIPAPDLSFLTPSVMREARKISLEERNAEEVSETESKKGQEEADSNESLKTNENLAPSDEEENRLLDEQNEDEGNLNEIGKMKLNCLIFLI